MLANRNLLVCTEDAFKVLLESEQGDFEEISIKFNLANMFEIENGNKDRTSEAHLKSSKTRRGSYLIHSFLSKLIISRYPVPLSKIETKAKVRSQRRTPPPPNNQCMAKFQLMKVGG